MKKFWKQITGYFHSHGTRMIGVAQGTIAALAGVAGIIPEHQLKYWLAASALLTYWRGQVNAEKLQPADIHDDGTAGESS